MRLVQTTKKVGLWQHKSYRN